MGGGSPSSTTTTVDPVYNAGLLELSKEQQGWAAEMFNQFKYGVTYDPNAVEQGAYINGEWITADNLKGYSGDYYIDNPEWSKWDKSRSQAWDIAIAQGSTDIDRWIKSNPEPEKQIVNPNKLQERTLAEINSYDPNAQTSEMEYLQNLVNSNQDLLGLQTDVSKAQLQSQLDLTPLSTEVAKMGLQSQKQLIPQQTAAQSQRYGLATTFMNDVNKGIDTNARMNEAQAGVQHGFKNARDTMTKNLQSFGLDPSSGMYASQNRDLALSEATGIAGARTQAKNLAEQEDFSRKAQALQITV